VALLLAVACSSGAVDGGATTPSRLGASNPTITSPAVEPRPPGATSTSASTSTSVVVGPSSSTTTDGAGTPGVVDGIPPVPDGPASALVDRLRVAGVDPELPDYRRKAFGGGWDYDGETGCNTRELVLIEESLAPPVMGDRCRPVSGQWISRYDGFATSDPADLEIDHFVPLAEAWRTGAAHWTDSRREAFANDLGDPATLVAVSSRSNRSKGDSPPDLWLPPSPDDRCPYVADWIRVKARWDLAVSPAEKSVLVQVLSGC